VLEVETPILGHGVVVESNIEPIPCRVREGAAPRESHLLASPEGPMKRLLAAGSGAIYQFAHAFRDGEVGRRHSPEFTILEWYRPGFDHHALMDEVEDLMRVLVPAVGAAEFERRTYRDVFLDGAGLDPFATSLDELGAACERLSVPLPEGFHKGTIDDALELLLVAHLEPSLGASTPLFVHDYPASQAALARVYEDGDGRRVARRFELYARGLELANGYHELGDPVEQRRRFEQANADRKASGRAPLPVDEDLLAALGAGLPACAGVALGFDRLMMVAPGANDIREVRALPFESLR
jgi:lysyl-tRNA synthetase class 2